MGEYGKLKSVRSRKIDYGRSFNENICFTNEQEAEAAIIKINQYKGWATELPKLLQKTKQNNAEPQNATQSNIKRQAKYSREGRTRKIKRRHTIIERRNQSTGNPKQ